MLAFKYILFFLTRGQGFLLKVCPTGYHLELIVIVVGAKINHGLCLESLSQSHAVFCKMLLFTNNDCKIVDTDSIRKKGGPLLCPVRVFLPPSFEEHETDFPWNTNLYLWELTEQRTPL